jgi:gliding motility-associated-like protein
MKYVAIVVFLCCGHFATAQTCTGGLGDPIVNITFGAGSNYGSALAPGITNMQYLPAACPQDGQYTIANGSINCFSGSWLNVIYDHTGDYLGYFMLINASYQPSDFYVQTVNGLCEGTTYQFAAWVLNMVAKTNEILPNITFRIEKPDGTLLGSSSDVIPQTTSPIWQQHGFFFTTPPGITSVVIRMTNNAPGGIGNDLALDDITFRATGPSIALQVTATASDTAAVCENDVNPLTITSVVESCYPSTEYQWQRSTDGGMTWVDIPGAVSSTYLRPPTPAGTYLYRLKAAQVGNIGLTCSIASKPVRVVVVKIPVPGVTIASSATQLCAGASADFKAFPVNGGNNPVYQWMVNSTGVGSNSPAYSSSTLTDGDIVSCKMTSNAFCVINPTTPSNTIAMSVIPHAVAGVSITASATSICSDSNVVFTAIPSNGGSTPSYQWKVDGVATGVDNPVYSSSGLQNGDVITCVMTGSQTCSLPVPSGNTITMTVYPLPVIRLTPDTIIAAGSSIRLSPQISGDVVNYQWSPAIGLDDAGVANPLASPVTSTAYSLAVVTQEGCRASAAETVNVFYDLLMPGGFTPNGDGKNDVFRVPPSVPVPVMRFQVFNRWGLLVFAATNSSDGWDGTWKGKPQPAGVYVWEIEYEDLLTKKKVTKGGTVILVR